MEPLYWSASVKCIYGDSVASALFLTKSDQQISFMAQ